MRGASDAARRCCQGWPRSFSLRMPQPLDACRHAERERTWPSPEAARSVLYSVEHGVTLIRVETVRPTLGWLAAADAVTGRSPSDQRGTCSLWRRTSPHNLVYGGPARGLDHDAVMRIGGRFRGGGSNLQMRRKGQGGHRRTATSDRLGNPYRQHPAGAELKVLRSSLVGGTRVHGRRRPFRSPPASARRRPAVRRSSHSATARSGSCAPAPRSWSCGYRPGHRRCARDTIAPGRCPSGT
jgi:hypothetical protein